MFTLLAHAVYFMGLLYAYKAYETYKAQKSLGVATKQALKNAAMWPKYSF